jgi:ABC-type antimicrobial peptide transport system permease subunit
VVVQTLAYVAVGAVVGLVGAVFVSRLVRSLVFEVSPLDPVALAVTGVLLVLTATAAAALPARRATAVDPVTALQGD